MSRAILAIVIAFSTITAGCFGSNDSIVEQPIEEINLETNIVWNTTGENRIMSSPQTIDLNGDGILDIVTGTGVEELETGSIIALDGSNGSLIWEVETDGEMFGSAKFGDLNNDQTKDIILGGRNKLLFAINGLNGEVLWQFDSNQTERETWFQFYTGIFIEDQDEDGVVDWLTSNGGDPSKGPFEERENGYIMIISGASGKIIAVADTPDGRETYMSPILYQAHPDRAPKILYGTGGETLSGSLWSTEIADIMSGNISNSKQIITGSQKGFLAPPSLTDLNLDGYLDIVTSTFDGRIVAIDGDNLLEIWSVNVAEHVMNGSQLNAESWASPAIGYFNSDNIPDVVAEYVIGEWPEYMGSSALIIDGESGKVLWTNDTEHSIHTSPLAIDMNNDGLDEVLIFRSITDYMANEFYGEAVVLDTSKFELQTIFDFEQVSVGTPMIVDLNQDGELELIFTNSSWYSSTENHWQITLFQLNSTAPIVSSWAGYLGTNADGIHQI